ncbi:synembryn-A isoform X2 [Neocloeon triangulifer]|uniref:synembryn-A isoform X2 n=1 Tax=Neocloeon triangulifer TaxID=2078957 RepID=UPI00286F40B8|nr:synembryn-A isoform X2 [Neocloeon triangulifer]
MDSNAVALLTSGSREDVRLVLTEFFQKNSHRFTFDDIGSVEKRRSIWNLIIKYLRDSQDSSFSQGCLNSLLILSRDKDGLGDFIEEDCIDLLLNLAGLGESAAKSDSSYDVALAALKCLSNLTFNSPVVQVYMSKGHCIGSILKRLKNIKDPNIPYFVKLFDLKLIFLITAKCPEIINRVRDEEQGVEILTNCLIDVIGASSSTTKFLTVEQTDLSSEILKALFNILVQNQDANIESQLVRLVEILRELLLLGAPDEKKLDDVRSHSVNLLMAIPPALYENLMPTINGLEDKPQFEGKNMEVLIVLSDFLYRRLVVSRTDVALSAEGVKNLMENVSPILTFLSQGCLIQRPMRKFLRNKILPPLTDEVMQRPETGDTSRNLLCALLTTPITQVRDLAADFLFVLCKEKVARFVKYVGYGNAAGLLANRGLMLGGRGRSGCYSSDSEDSDTDEYKLIKDQINPIVGCFEEPRPDPMENMSDEQKEYEAVKLVEKIDQLTRSGIIQPCRVGPDGRPVPVEHVLQLQEELERLHAPLRNDDSEDSD